MTVGFSDRPVREDERWACYEMRRTAVLVRVRGVSRWGGPGVVRWRVVLFREALLSLDLDHGSISGLLRRGFGVLLLRVGGLDRV